MNHRRNFLRNVFGLGAGLAVAPAVLNAERKADARERTRTGYPVIVETPDIPNLPFTMDNGVKVFNLIAEPVKREIVPGRVIDAWGYNGTTPGPTIQVNNGDRVRIVLENRLPEPTSMHWHGFEIPIAMDGMPYISQKPIAPGEKFVYEFTLHQEGTFFYHSHGAMQEMMGMLGMFIMHPKQAHSLRVDHDFGLVLQEWALLPNNSVPNTANMEFNWLTINGRSGPSATPLLVRLGSRVRIRFVNIGMDHHPMHLHGNTFWTTGTEGGRQPESTWTSGNTVLVGVAQARDVEFVANNPGDWMLHCHLPHHMMNNMSDLISERMMTTSALSSEQAQKQMEMMAKQGGHGMHGSMEHLPAVAANANSVPGFPQDAFMEMPMDAAVVKPENEGLAKNWTAGMMGMMTLVRVLSSDKYNEIMALKKSAPQQVQHHEHGG
jgi:manganese oxidase